jgi:hypothetical protein
MRATLERSQPRSQAARSFVAWCCCLFGIARLQNGDQVPGSEPVADATSG